MEKCQPREKTKSLLGLKRKTGLSSETGRGCRPDITGKNRSAASATTRQKIVEATSNVELSSDSRPLDIFRSCFLCIQSIAPPRRSIAKDGLASVRRLPNHVFATFTASRCHAAIGCGGYAIKALLVQGARAVAANLVVRPHFDQFDLTDSAREPARAV